MRAGTCWIRALAHIGPLNLMLPVAQGMLARRRTMLIIFIFTRFPWQVLILTCFMIFMLPGVNFVFSHSRRGFSWFSRCKMWFSRFFHAFHGQRCEFSHSLWFSCFPVRMVTRSRSLVWILVIFALADVNFQDFSRFHTPGCEISRFSWFSRSLVWSFVFSRFHEAKSIFEAKWLKRPPALFFESKWLPRKVVALPGFRQVQGYMMLQLMLAANVRKCGVRPVLSLPESDKGVPSSVQVQLVVPRFWLAKNDFTPGSIGPKSRGPFWQKRGNFNKLKKTNSTGLACRPLNGSMTLWKMVMSKATLVRHHRQAVPFGASTLVVVKGPIEPWICWRLQNHILWLCKRQTWTRRKLNNFFALLLPVGIVLGMLQDLPELILGIELINLVVSLSWLDRIFVLLTNMLPWTIVVSCLQLIFAPFLSFVFINAPMLLHRGWIPWSMNFWSANDPILRHSCWWLEWGSGCKWSDLLHMFKLYHTQLFHTRISLTHASFTHNSCTLIHNPFTFTYKFLKLPILTVFPPFSVPLQPLFLIIGRSWLVGLSGPLIV